MRGSKPQGTLRASTRGVGLRGRLEAFDRTLRRLTGRASPMLLRISLGIVFVWFGALKVAGVSAVGGLVASTVPFLDSAWFVPVLGVLEILMGLAFATGRLLRVVLPMFALHMGGTFLVLIMLPEIAFEQANPLLLTVRGRVRRQELGAAIRRARRRVGREAAPSTGRGRMTDGPIESGR